MLVVLVVAVVVLALVVLALMAPQGARGGGHPITITDFIAIHNPVNENATTTLTVSASGGLGALTYSYGGLPLGCASANASTLPCTPSTYGTFTLQASVSDTHGDNALAYLSLVVNQSVSKPYVITFGGSTPSSQGGNFYDNVSVGSTSSGPTTAVVGFEIITPSGTRVASAAAVCTAAPAGGGISTCSASSGGWYLVLVGPTGNWLASFPSSVGGTSWNGGPVGITPADTLVLIYPTPLAGTGDMLDVFGINGASATGTTTL